MKLWSKQFQKSANLYVKKWVWLALYKENV